MFIIIIFFLLMFLTVLKEQPFGSDHFLVFNEINKKKKKKSALKGVWLFLSAGVRGWPKVGLNCSLVGLKMKKATKKSPIPAKKSSLSDCLPFILGGFGVVC